MIDTEIVEPLDGRIGDDAQSDMSLPLELVIEARASAIARSECRFKHEPSRPYEGIDNTFV